MQGIHSSSGFSPGICLFYVPGTSCDFCFLFIVTQKQEQPAFTFYVHVVFIVPTAYLATRCSCAIICEIYNICSSNRQRRFFFFARFRENPRRVLPRHGWGAPAVIAAEARRGVADHFWGCGVGPELFDDRRGSRLPSSLPAV